MCGLPVALCLLLALSLGGCTLVGPPAMRASRLAYNEAVQQSEQRELLLNVVRLRYDDVPEFLAVSGISTQLSLEASAGIGGIFGQDADADSDLVTPNASLGFAENPTLSFTPQRDSEFSRQLLAPVEIDSLLLLSQSGWELGRIMRLLARSVNDLRNDPVDAPERLQSFIDTMATLDQLERANLADVVAETQRQPLLPPVAKAELDFDKSLQLAESGYVVDPVSAETVAINRESAAYVLRFGAADGAVADLQQRLNLAPGRARYDIDPGMRSMRGQADQASDRLWFDSRSVLGAMGYLANGVDVPERDIEAAIVRDKRALQALYREFFTVSVSARRPRGAYLSVPYRGRWFSIAAGDLESRRTLALLATLVRLTINAGGANNVPVLTLPLAR